MEVISVVFHTSFSAHSSLLVFSTQVLYVVKQSGFPVVHCCSHKLLFSTKSICQGGKYGLCLWIYTAHVHHLGALTAFTPFWFDAVRRRDEGVRLTTDFSQKDFRRRASVLIPAPPVKKKLPRACLRRPPCPIFRIDNRALAHSRAR